MTFEEFKETFLDWTVKNIEEPGVCPYAKKARLQDKIQFIDCPRGIYGEFLEFDSDRYDIGIAWLGEYTSGIDQELDDLRASNPDLYYFLSTPNSGYFAKNFTNCVFIQKKDDILEKREYLKTTGYYNNWPKWYYDEICTE